MKPQKHANISIFVPHIGCTHACSFCNQRSISGETKAPTAQTVKETCQNTLPFLKSRELTAEIAFFGGSFTAIERGYMLSLLEAAHEFIDGHLITGIRLSTRPDCIDEEILTLLKSYGVTAIELGVQSLDQQVLDLNRREHSAECASLSSRMIQDAGFELGLQMMTGLYGDTLEKCRETAEKIIAMRPDTVRIYPTVVIKNTELAALYQSGKYTPQTLEEAVSLCAGLLLLFEQENIRVIRLGLHASELLEKDRLAGPFHPAFRELCENKIYFDVALKQLPLYGDYSRENVLLVSPGCRSKMVGQGKINMEKLSGIGYNVKVREDSRVKKYEVRIEE